MDIHPDTKHRNLPLTLGRWAAPAAVLLALAGTGAAHATQIEAGHGAAFDPGAGCAGSPPPQVAGTDQPFRLPRLVISAHAASVHAAR